MYIRFTFPKTCLITLFMVFILMTMPHDSWSQISGTQTIGAGGDFETFTEAASALNDQGISGPVTFNVLTGTYTEQFELSAIAGAGVSDTIVFQSQTGNPADVTLSYGASSLDDNFIIRLNGSQHISIKNMTLRTTGDDYANGIIIQGTAAQILIKNNVFHGLSSTSALERRTMIYSNDPNVEDITITGNTFYDFAFGVFLYGYNNNYIHGTRITDNEFYTEGYAGIRLGYNYAPQVSHNLIWAQSYGMRIGSDYGAGRFEFNKIISEYRAMDITRLGPDTDRALVANNFITLTGVGHYGLAIWSSVYMDIYNNSVFVTSSYNASAAFYCASGAINGTVNVRNNNFVNLNSGYAVSVGNPDVINHMDHNNLYTAGNSVAYWNDERIMNLRELQQTSGKNAHSVSVIPHYAAFDDLHTSAPWLDGRGIPLPEIAVDYDSEPRDAQAPDIGADEFTPDPSTTTPLSGTYSIGSGGDYPDFTSAIDDALIKGVSGPLVFDILSGIYDERIEMPSIPGSSAENTITFQSQSGDTNDVELTNSATGIDDNFIVRLNGADFITFQNLTFRTLDEQYGLVFDIRWGVDSLQIRDNSIHGISASGAQSEKIIVYSGDSFFRSRLIEGNTFHRGSYSLYIRREAANLPYSQGLQLLNNTFKKNGYSTAYLQFMDAPFISGNIIHAQSYGLQLYSCINNTKVLKNKVYTQSQYSIFLSGCPGTMAEPALVANNFSYIGGTETANGIYILSSNYMNVYHNSVHVTSTSTTAGRALYVSNSAQVKVINNILANTGGGYVLYKENTADIVLSDHNDLYATGSNLAFWNFDHISLASLRAESGMDLNSLSTDPGFVSDTDLHSSAGLLDLAGTPLLSVTEDIDGENRDPLTPDIGADEFGESSGGITEFSLVDTELPGLVAAKASWGDYDNDGDLDLLLTGSNEAGMLITQISNNINGRFYAVETAMQGVGFGSADWGDYDNDGDLDILITGEGISGNALTKLYRNDGGGIFTDTEANLVNVYHSDAAWGDYDRDGDLDILISGATGSFPAYNPVTKLYRNQGDDIFVEVTGNAFPGYDHCALAWADYDNDGDLDFILTGSYQSKIFRNFGSDVFVEQMIELTGVTSGAVAWGDYDCDGDLDLALSGRAAGNTLTTEVYRNDEGVFNQINAGLPGISDGSLDWGDYDNDGYPDLAICGGGNEQLLGAIYRSEHNGNFSVIPTGIQGVIYGNTDWGDFDKDGDLDLVITGSARTEIHINDNDAANTSPSPPGNLHVSAAHNAATFYWDPATDDQTPSAGLTYNLRVGTAPGLSNIMSPMALGDGQRMLPDMGNVQQQDHWNLEELLPGITYYWSVQSVDNGYLASPFSTEGYFITPYPTYFNEIATTLPGLYSGSVEWGDYDNDGDPDLLLTGKDIEAMAHSYVYRNDGNGNFTNSGAALTDVANGAASWGDYDNDGDLDIVLCGTTGEERALLVYRNDGSGIFTDIHIEADGLTLCDVAWADFDNDGDLDILHAGERYSYGWGSSTQKAYTNIYRNDGNDTFTEAFTTDSGLGHAAVDWGDFDKDGDMDFLVMGLEYEYYQAGYSYVKTVDRNLYIFDNEGDMQFSLIQSFTGQPAGAAMTGDYDNDGDLDILMSGYYHEIIEHTYAPPTIIDDYETSVRINGNGSFSLSTPVLPGVSGASAWADFDNDGDLDILITGNTDYGAEEDELNTITRMFRNDGDGQVTELVIDLVPVTKSAVAWGNFNNDNALDLIIMGLDTSGTPVIKLYRNQENKANLRTLAPSNLHSSPEGTSVLLSWDAAVDDKTPTPALSYNLRVGTTPGGTDVVAPLTLENGLRTVYHPGNTSQNTNWILHNLAPNATYYWSVQAIDNAFIGGVPAYEQSFTTDPPLFSSVDAGFVHIIGKDASWGDYDNDGDLDLFLTGYIPGYYSNIPHSFLYRNDGDDQFTDIEFEFSESFAKTALWGDYNRDGYLDLLLCEVVDGVNKITILRNNGDDSFVRLPVQTVSGGLHALNWADLDNDGDLDIAAGFAETIDYAKFYSCKLFQYNNEDEFFYTKLFETDLLVSRLIIADYDNDGLADIFVTGKKSTTGKTKIFRNMTNMMFSETDFELTGGDKGDMAVGDYDNDGDLDLLVAGDKGTGYSFADERRPFCAIYRNENGESFTDTGVDLPGTDNSDLFFADFDNDGLLDLFTNGKSDDGMYITRLYKNIDGENFINLAGLFESVGSGCASAADYNNDGKIDIIVSGIMENNNGDPLTTLYQNNCTELNSTPNAPSGLSTEVIGTNVRLSWNPASDDETPDGSLTYNLRIGTHTNGSETMSSASHADGLRKIVDLGNMFMSRSYYIGDLLPDMTYYWSVQSIDQAYTGSPFATEVSFITGTFKPQLLSVKDVPFETGGQVTLTWSKSVLDTNIYQVPHYSIWRAVPVGMKTLPKQNEHPNIVSANPSQPLRLFKSNGMDYVWEWMADQPAQKFDYYSYTAPTLFDSSATALDYHYYLVSVHTADPAVFHDSAVDSARSVDNLDQLAQSNLLKMTGATGNERSMQQQSPHGAEILSVRDVKHDQGSRVTLSFRSSDLDSGQHIIQTYSVWRALPGDNGYAWEKVAEQQAHHFFHYSMTIPTLYDSISLTDGMHQFLVCAHTANKNVFYESGIGTGCSVDNLAPRSPRNLSGALQDQQVTLHWNPNEEADLKSYLVYRSDSPGIDPSVLKPYAVSVDTSFTDMDPITNGSNYYLVRAQDIHENTSMSSNEIRITVVGLIRSGDEIPVDYALYQNYPNPFNPYTTIAFDLPENGSVHLTIHNLRGQRVVTLVDGCLAAGHYCYPWRPEGMASGLYIYTIQTDNFRKIRKMVLVK